MTKIYCLVRFIGMLRKGAFTTYRISAIPFSYMSRDQCVSWKVMYSLKQNIRIPGTATEAREFFINKPPLFTIHNWLHFVVLGVICWVPLHMFFYLRRPIHPLQSLYQGEILEYSQGNWPGSINVLWFPTLEAFSEICILSPVQSLTTITAVDCLMWQSQYAKNTISVKLG